MRWIGKTLDRCFVLVPDSPASTDVHVNLLDPLNTPSTTCPGDNSPRVVHCLCESTRVDGSLIQCDACTQWLHPECIHVTSRPSPFICVFCQHTITAEILTAIRIHLKRLRSADAYGDLTVFWTDTLAVIEDVGQLLHVMPSGSVPRPEVICHKFT
jgi:hypothetical protein